MSDISKLHTSLKSVKYKEEKKINYNKLLTIITFAFALVVGGYMLVKNTPSITGFVTDTTERSNSCNIYQEFFSVTSTTYITCSVEKNKNDFVELSLANHAFGLSKGIIIEEIKLNSCVSVFNKTIKPSSEANFSIVCIDKKLSNDLTVTYKDIQNGVSYKITGNTILV